MMSWSEAASDVFDLLVRTEGVANCGPCVAVGRGVEEKRGGAAKLMISTCPIILNLTLGRTACSPFREEEAGLGRCLMYC